MENQPIRQEFPAGMIIILILLGLHLWTYLITMLRESIFQFGPVLMMGLVATIIKLLISGIVAVIFYGIVKRFKWARKLAIGFYAFFMILKPINLVSIMSNKSMYDVYFQKHLPLANVAVISKLVFSMQSVAAVLGVIIDFAIIFYLIRKKDFFVN